jgi:TetR/AcrR family transcriptional regulator, transcriptional repressor of bet genes
MARPALDSDQRRRSVAEAVVRIIAREGLDAATIRRVASEVGFSTTVVTHYFADKHQLLLWTYRNMGEIALARIDDAVTGNPADLLRMLLAMTAVDEPHLELWRTYVAIWDISLRDSDLAAELKSWTDVVSKRISAHVRALKPACPEADIIAKRLLALVRGISIELLFDRESWSADAVSDALASEIELLVG